MRDLEEELALNVVSFCSSYRFHAGDVGTKVKGKARFLGGS
jgi:hypothetical protein